MPAKFAELEDCCHELMRLVAGTNGDINGPGGLLAAAYVHLAAEHNHSTCALAKKCHFASALALVRPFVEALARHYWFLHVATELDVDRFHEGVEPLKVKEIVAVLHERRPDIARQLEGIWDHAKVLHDYTHGGQRQIGRRFVEVDTIGCAFSDEDIEGLEGLCRANILSTAIGYAEQARDPRFTREMLELVNARVGLPGGLSVEWHLGMIHPPQLD